MYSPVYIKRRYQPNCTNSISIHPLDHRFSLNGPVTLLYTYDLHNSMKERPYFFIKIYIPHTLFSKGLMCLWCVRDEWRQGQTAILNQLLRLTIACCVVFKSPLSSSFTSWLGLLNRDLLRATALSLQASPHCGLPVQLTQLPQTPAYILS